jgi:TPP-dependent pyruvate/acetoin dehydrogenase alpha subunit
MGLKAQLRDVQFDGNNALVIYATAKTAVRSADENDEETSITLLPARSGA